MCVRFKRQLGEAGKNRGFRITELDSKYKYLLYISLKINTIALSALCQCENKGLIHVESNDHFALAELGICALQKKQKNRCKKRRRT